MFNITSKYYDLLKYLFNGMGELDSLDLLLKYLYDNQSKGFVDLITISSDTGVSDCEVTMYRPIYDGYIEKKNSVYRITDAGKYFYKTLGGYHADYKVKRKEKTNNKLFLLYVSFASTLLGVLASILVQECSTTTTTIKLEKEQTDTFPLNRSDKSQISHEHE